jgi:hypothetical protein
MKSSKQSHNDTEATESGPDVPGQTAGIPDQTSIISNAQLPPANQLYDSVQRLIENTIPLDEQTARIIVEAADDAIKEFGNTNQEKKVELKKWKGLAEEVLPPRTIKELKERAEGQLLQKGYPRQALSRKLLISGIGIMVLAVTLVGVYKAFVDTKSVVLPGSGPGDGTTSDSVTVNLPDGLTLRSAIKFLAQIDSLTADFKQCNEQLLTTEVEGGPLTGKSTLELIELLKLRLKRPGSSVNFQVARMPQKGTYEISCN